MIEVSSRVYVHTPKWGRPFYGTVDAVSKDNDGAAIFLVSRTPTSGASWYTADQIRPTRGNRKATPPTWYAIFTEGGQRYYAVAPDMSTAIRWVEAWTTHPNKSRPGWSHRKPRNAHEIPMYGDPVTY